MTSESDTMALTPGVRNGGRHSGRQSASCERLRACMPRKVGGEVARRAVGVGRVSPALMLILGGAFAGVGPPPEAAPPSPQAPATANADSVDESCRSKDARDIVVCAQRRQEYRIDPSVIDAGRQAEAINRSMTSPAPAAQAVCSSQPMGCGRSPASLDLANVALVAVTTAIRAAKGEDWTRGLKPGGPDEYQLYREAKARREVEDTRRAAASARRKAQEAEREARSAFRGSGDR